MIIDLTALTDEELEQLQTELEDEVYSRKLIAVAEGAVNNVIEQYHQAVNRGLADGEVPNWTQPVGAHDSYPKDYTVNHSGKVWTSLASGNVWEPGVSGWREVLPDGQISAWVQPTGAHDAYDRGAVVTHNEFTWVSDVDANVWEPGVYGWTKQ